MSTRNTAILLILAAFAYLAWNGRKNNTPERQAERAAAAQAQTERWHEVAAKVSAMPGFTVPSGQDVGHMRIITTQHLSDYDARKFCKTVQDQLGYEAMVRLVDDTGAVLTTRY